MTALFQDRARADAACEKLKAFAQPKRLMILSYLLGGERTVSDIDAATGIGQPALSQQLAELRRAELVATRREGKMIWYDLADDQARLCVKTLEILMGDDPNPVGLFRSVGQDNIAAAPTEPSVGTAGFARIL